MVARDVRSYICAHERADESEEHALRSVCSGLARLLAQLLEGHEKWNRYQWVDSVLPTLAAVVSDKEVSVVGYMIWGTKGSGRQWLEPFSLLCVRPKMQDFWAITSCAETPPRV